MKRKSELIIAAAVLCVLLGTGSFWVFSEKDMPHPSNEERITVHYRGLGLNDSSGGWRGLRAA